MTVPPSYAEKFTRWCEANDLSPSVVDAKDVLIAINERLKTLEAR